MAGALLLLIAAAFSCAQPLDVLVLLDESGSMYGNDRPVGDPKRVVAQDPQFLRYAAIQCLARKLRPGDRLAVVPFGSHPMEEFRIEFRDPFADEDWTRLAARGKIGKAQSSGTDYVSAFQQAGEVFGPADAARGRIAILLSDGDPVANQLAGVYREASRFLERTGARLFTIGLGANFRTDVLTQLAQTGRGRAFQAADPAQLPFQFAEVLREGGNREVRTPQKEGTFVVGPMAAELRAISVSIGDQPTFALRSPSGTRVVPTLDSAAYPEGQPSRVGWLRVPDPEPGVWTIEGDPASLDVAYESALKIQIVLPDEGETLSNEGSTAVRMEVEGTTPQDDLQGTLTVRWSDGTSKSLPVNFRGASAQSVLDLDEAPPGRADLTAEIERRFLGEVERGVPGRRQVLIVAAPPGVPAARAVILGESEQKLWKGSLAKLTVQIEANREAVGSTLLVEAGQGWTASPIRIDRAGSKLYPLDLRGPYQTKRGPHRTTLSLKQRDANLELTSEPFAFAVEVKDWTDWLLTFSRWVLVPLSLAILTLLAAIGVGIWRAGKIKEAKRKALDTIRITLDGREVALNQLRKDRGSSERTFGSVATPKKLADGQEDSGESAGLEDSKADAEFDYHLVLPEKSDVRFTAKVKQRGRYLVFSEGALESPVNVLPGEPGFLKLAGDDSRTYEATYEEVPGLEGLLRRGTHLLLALALFGVVSLGLAFLRGLAELDAKTKAPEEATYQAGSLQPN